jgi:hypothetical protein
MAMARLTHLMTYYGCASQDETCFTEPEVVARVRFPICTFRGPSRVLCTVGLRLKTYISIWTQRRLRFPNAM